MKKVKECQEWQPISGGLNTIPTSEVGVQHLILTPSLFLRLLEWAKEEAQGDVCLHQVLEKLLNLNSNTPIGMDMYDYLLANVSCNEENEVADSGDIENALEQGFNQALLAGSEGRELSSDGDNYSLVASKYISDYKDDEYGASNAEIEAFWDGVEKVEQKRENETCDDCQLFDEDEDGLSSLNQFREKFNIDIEPKKEEPKSTLTITPDEDNEIERIIKLAQFK